MIEDKFMGIVTDIIDEHSFIFRSDNSVKCQVGQVVGLNISNDIYMLAYIVKIDVDYFLNNAEEYFTSLASDNKLMELSKGERSPKYSQRAMANYIGIYEFSNTDKRFIESIFSINSYTPKIYQKVASFHFDCIEVVYGLKQNIENHFKLGAFLYPSYSVSDILPDVNVSTETFHSHTLISGVTGSGKSRLTALIANQLASNGGHITIIDPHDEYVNFADTNTAQVSFFSVNEQSHNKRKDIRIRNLSLTNQYLTPLVLEKLLPNLSDQQLEYIHEVYTDITLDNPQNISLRKIIDTTIQKFNSDYISEGHSKEILLQAQQYAKKDTNYLPFINRYIFYLNKEWYSGKKQIARAAVSFSLLNRLVNVFEDEIFPDNTNYPTPAWLDYNTRNSINIINIAYDSLYVRRFVNTIIQCFFTPQVNNRILIVDEAHLLFNDKSDKLGTAVLLSRLLRESRKFKLSIIFITQNEIDIPEEIKSQFQNRFRFREEKSQELKYLSNQTCMCSIYGGKRSFPMRVDTIEIVK